MTHYALGLIGYPIKHSLSPLLHRTALQATGLEGSYQCIQIMPWVAEAAAQPGSIPDLIRSIKLGKLHGLNVTLPYKQTVIPWLDGLSNIAKSIGAVNTIFTENQQVLGENTDAAGFRNDLVRLGFDRPASAGGNALVLGAGGSARAVVFILQELGWRIRIAARRAAQAQELIDGLQASSGKIQAISWNQESFLYPYELIVNTTPLGMPDEKTSNPWPEDIPLPPGAIVYDLVYQQRTALVDAALGAGLRAAGGLGMLIEQAALAFEIWTGQNVPRDPLWQAAQSHDSVMISGKEH